MQKLFILLLAPAEAIMRRLSFSKKFTLLGATTLITISIALFSLYTSMSEAINQLQKEREGLALIQPLTKTIQSLQEYRGLSSGVLSGISDLSANRIAKEAIVADTFNRLSFSLPKELRQTDSWKSIVNEWSRIRASGMQWSQPKNFITHTQLISELLLLESSIADDYALTADPSLDTFYLIHTSGNELLSTMEHLGQVRAYSIATLGAKHISEQQKSELVSLMTLLEYTLYPLKINLDKVAHYNPSLQSMLTETYNIINVASQSVIKKINADILSERFAMSRVDYFAFTTAAIDNGYTQLHQSLLPVAESLIQARIQRASFVLNATLVFASILLLLLVYFLSAIHRTTIGNIKILTKSVLGFIHGDMLGRVDLNTHDELTTIGEGFNIMADELAELITDKQSTLDLFMKIAHSVPGVVYQFRQRVDGSSCFPFASEGICEIYRVSPDEVREDATKVFLLIYPADLEELVASIQTSAQNLTQWYHEYRVQFDDGTVKWLLGNAMPERETDGATLWHGFITDVTARKISESNLHMLSTATEQSPASVIITNIDAEIEYVNPRFTLVTGYSPDEIIGKNPRVLQSCLTDSSVYVDMWSKLTQGKSWAGEFVNKRKNDEIYYEEAYISPIQENDGTTSHYVAVKLDVTARKKMEEQVRQLAFYDTLTKLPNRRLLNDRLSQIIAASKRTGHYSALMFLDLDNFKPLNDKHGHEVGDMLLLEAANRLTSCIREMDTVARFGGDEFVVMLGELDADQVLSTTKAAVVAEKMRASLTEPYQFTISHANQPITHIKHRCTGSIGVMIFNGSEGSQDDLMRWADAVMYEAKDAGRNQIKFYGEQR